MVPLYGIKTGFNDAFLIDTTTKEKLVNADPKSEFLFQTILREAGYRSLAEPSGMASGCWR